MEDGTVAALVGATNAASAVITAVVTTLIKDRKAARKDSLDEYRDIIARLQKSVDRLQASDDQKQQTINELYRLHSDCEADRQVDHASMVLLHDVANGLADDLARLGQPRREIPDLPERPARLRKEKAEQLRRTTEHNTQLGRQAREAAQRQIETDNPGNTDTNRP
jgi:hypothetical protein